MSELECSVSRKNLSLFLCSFSFPQYSFIKQCAAAQLILEKTKNNSVVCEIERRMKNSLHGIDFSQKKKIQE